jgi:N-acetylmuramoyl-L-alanine amidase
LKKKFKEVYSYILFAFCFIIIVWGIYPENTLNLEKGNYFKTSQLIDSTKIKISEKEKLTDIVEVVGSNQNKINFLVNSNFLSYKGAVHLLNYKVRYKNKELYLPIDALKYILTYLVDENFSFTITTEQIYYKIYSKELISQENISLQNIIIDPGHGGREYGATSIHADHEKIYNLEISILLE